MCGKVKCGLCPTVLKACKMINGVCPSCYAKKEAEKAQNAINKPKQ